jgi:hypothetical protein
MIHLNILLEWVSDEWEWKVGLGGSQKSGYINNASRYTEKRTQTTRAIS